MPNIPEGQYRFPLGILLVSSSERFPAMIRIIPKDHTIPDKVVEFTLFWFNDEEKGLVFDGSEVGFGDGISEEESEELPPDYRYEGYGADEEVDLEVVPDDEEDNDGDES